MKNILPILVFVLLTFVISCQQPKENEPDLSEAQRSDSFKFKWEAIADKIITKAAIQPGEKILLVAKPGEFDTLLFLLKKKIEVARGQYLGAISVTPETPDDWYTDFTRQVAGKSREALSKYFEAVDLGIMLPGADTTHLPYAAMQEVLRSGKGRTIHFHWAGAYQLNGSLLPRSELVDELYQTAILNTNYRHQYFFYGLKHDHACTGRNV